jgi:23S rRNA pseudouridine2605 synthase
MQIRLQKILSTAGIASRRAAEEFITQGRVTVNGTTVSELGSKADPETDDIRVDGRRLKMPARRRYILLYKPKGYITTRSDPERRPTVLDLLTTGGVRDYVYPVGRLDYDSEGLLLLTSDGDLAEKLTHPKHGMARVPRARARRSRRQGAGTAAARYQPRRRAHGACERRTAQGHRKRARRRCHSLDGDLRRP